MTARYVRICPVCEQENPPERARCTCGASLAGVDFSLERSATPPSAPALESPGSTSDAASSVVETAPSGEKQSATNVLAADAPPSIICPHVDCGQPNPAGSALCVYCNRPLTATAAPEFTARPLPRALRDDYRVVEPLAVAGSESDLLLVERVATGGRCVAKLYRRGFAPDPRLVRLLAGHPGEHIVRVLAHGTSEGIHYEIVEYIPQGTLRELMAKGPMPRDDVIAIVREIAAALDEIHAHKILHRDLKPENVLVRTESPLRLALTDFGIASLRDATQHFTGTARTTSYAAPEALTGVIDDKADWWALGMIVLEAASGRHPFAGLSEQVMSHHLATRPVDARGVYDDRLRMLCRGLLLRDPKRRWGSAEVSRWLAGDATLFVGDDAEGPASVVRPYRLGATDCATAAELAVAMARHWELARRDIARGQIARWLEHELHDYNLVRKLADLREDKSLNDDQRLLQFLVAAAPDLPPVWRGLPADAAAIIQTARKAVGGDNEATAWLETLYRDEGLATLISAGHAELMLLDRTWRDGGARFLALWDTAREAEEAWRKEPRPIAGNSSARVASFDDLVYAAARFAPPPQTSVNGALLLAVNDEAYRTALSAQVAAGRAEVAALCLWFDRWCETAEREPAGLLAAQLLLPHARDDAAMEGRRHAANEQARTHIIAEVRDELRSHLRTIENAIAEEDHLDYDEIARLTELLNDFQDACQRALRLGFADEEYRRLVVSVETLSDRALAVQRALARCEEVKGVNAIFQHPERLAIGAVLIVIVLLFRIPVVVYGTIVVVGSFVLYRWYKSYAATEAALSALRSWRLHARTFIREGPAGPATDEKASPRRTKKH